MESFDCESVWLRRTDFETASRSGALIAKNHCTDKTYLYLISFSKLSTVADTLRFVNEGDSCLLCLYSLRCHAARK